MVDSIEDFKQRIESVANRPYHFIKDLMGEYAFNDFRFQFKTIQGSPGAHPASITAITLKKTSLRFPQLCYSSDDQLLAFADFLIRRFSQGIKQFARQNRGIDGSGSFHTIELGQTMLQRDSVILTDNHIELRFICSLPAKRTDGIVFDAQQACVMINDELSTIVAHTFAYENYEASAKKWLTEQLAVQRTRQSILQYMQAHDLIVFINNGAILPRSSGIADIPAEGEHIQAFTAPKTLEVSVPLENGKIIKGMGIKQGITCITGGGFHGKSTLLHAILAGVYAHIPGDGREYIVTREDAVYISAEQGRNICDVDISPFISDLPTGKLTQRFSTTNASGSTSQAAGIVESIESGSRFLLFDEDSCAVNFLYRDALINQIVSVDKEPIKPLFSILHSLSFQHQLSMIFVVGGIGGFIQKADTCLLMESYQCHDVTRQAREKLGNLTDSTEVQLVTSSKRYLATANFDPTYTNERLKKTIKKRIKDLRGAPKQLEYGMDLLNLEALPQLVEAPQIRSIGYCLYLLGEKLPESPELKTVKQWLDWLENEINNKGLDGLSPDYPSLLSRPRKYEIAAAINRIRSLTIVEKDGGN